MANQNEIYSMYARGLHIENMNTFHILKWKKRGGRGLVVNISKSKFENKFINNF